MFHLSLVADADFPKKRRKTNQKPSEKNLIALEQYRNKFEFEKKLEVHSFHMISSVMNEVGEINHLD